MKRLRHLLSALLALSLTAPSIQAATGTVMPVPKIQWFTDVGTVCSGCKLYTYAAGTTTPQATYTTSALTVANANPVVADSAGRTVVYLSATAYKFILKTSTDVTIWTEDNVTQVPQTSGNVDLTGVAGEALSAGNAVYLSDGSGGNTAGRWYKTDSDFSYASNDAAIVGFAVDNVASAATGTFRILGSVTGLSALVAGTKYYVDATAGTITSTAPSNSRFVGEANTTTSLVVSPNPNVPNASATVAGIVTLQAQTLGQGSKSIQAGGSASTALLTGVLNVQTNTATNCGTSETTLFTYDIPASAINAAGRGFWIRTWGITSANANNKRFRLYVGAVVISDSTAAAYNAQNWKFVADVLRTGTSTQTSSTKLTIAAAGLGNIEWLQDTDLTATETAAITVKVTGLCPSNAADVTSKGWIVGIY